jgi:hypothetical protein
MNATVRPSALSAARIARGIRNTAFPLVLPLLGGCLLLPLASDLKPGIGLEAVERSPAHGVRTTPILERDRRGSLFVDSLIVFRTWANTAVVRFRVWNHGREPITILPGGRVLEPRPGECAPPEGPAEPLPPGDGGSETVMAPGASREYEATAGALVPGAGASTWQPGDVHCLDYDPAAQRGALRLAVEARGARYVYTFWYRAAEGP